MAYTIGGPFQDALDSFARYGVILYTFAFGTGTYGLWNLNGERTIGGVVYRGGGSLLVPSQVEQNSDGSVSSLTLSLSADPSKGLTADVVESFYTLGWHNKVVTIELGMLDAATRAVIDKQRIFRGLTQTAPYTIGVDKNRIDLNISSQSIKLSISGGAYRNGQSQDRIDNTDTSLDLIGSLNPNVQKSIKWGQ